ncbi:MAG: response regulator [Balneolales bacterium]
MCCKHILLVEDEFLVGMNIQITLRNAGFKVTGPAMKIEEALLLIDENEFDGAVLDVNLGGNSSCEVATKLTELGIPFIFLTGYTRDNLPFDINDIMVLEKPFHDEKLIETVKGLWLENKNA